MKQLRLLLLVLLLLTSKAINAYDFEVGNIYYQITSSTQMTCSVVSNGFDNSYSGDVVIPAKVVYEGNEYVVTGIEYATFRNCIKLKSISLPSTIKNIAHYAFSGCILLKEFNVPKDVTSLQSDCFEGCVSLEKVSLGNIKKIEIRCFKGCVSLEELKIPQTVTEVENWAFEDCSSLASLTIEDGKEILTLGYDDHGGLFADCPLVDVYVGRNLEYTSGSYSDGVDRLSPFASNKTLKTITLGDNVTKVGKYFCYKCPMLRQVLGMQNVTTLGENAFYECTSLKNFVVRDNVTSIGSRLLCGCTSLENLIIGNGVEKIEGSIIIYGCNKLKNVYLGKGLRQIGGSDFCDKGVLSNANVYLFSDQLSEMYIYINSKNGAVTGGIPTDVKAVYVANPERYETLLGKYYNVKPMLVFNENSLEYTGKIPDLSYRNNVEGMEVSFDKSSTPKDVGTYKTNVDVVFSNDDWSVSLELPCEYTVTKAPLTIIANDAQRCYKEENPQLTCSYVGLKNGESIDVLDVEPTVFTTANTESNVGTYPIYCSGAETRNYELNYKEGKLTIIKAEQDINWSQDLSEVAVGVEYELTATSNSGLPVKYRSSDLSTVMITSKNGKQYAYMLKSGSAVLTAYQNGNNNYNEAYEVNKLINVTATAIDNVPTMKDNEKETFYSIDGKRLAYPIKGIMVVKKGKTVKRVIQK